MIAIDKGKYLNMAENVANATEINAIRNSRLFFLSPLSLLLKGRTSHIFFTVTNSNKNIYNHFFYPRLSSPIPS